MRRQLITTALLFALALGAVVWAWGRVSTYIAVKDALRADEATRAWAAHGAAVQALAATQSALLTALDSAGRMTDAYDGARTQLELRGDTVRTASGLEVVSPEIAAALARCDEMAASIRYVNTSYVPYRTNVDYVVRTATVAQQAEAAAKPGWIRRTWETIDAPLAFALGVLGTAAVLK